MTNGLSDMSSGQVGSVDVVPDAVLNATPRTIHAASGSAPEVSRTAAIDHSGANLHGVLLGLAAAVTYSIANLALRGLAKTDSGLGWSMWVAGTKAFPTFFVAIILICVRRWRGQTSFTDWNFVWPIAVAAFFNQLGGNLAFQLSLVKIGLAISVPICFSSIICSGAIVGRFVLGDAVSVRTGISMGLMVASIIFLSTAATNRTTAVVSAAASASAQAIPGSDDWGTATGVALAMISGLAYGITGVYIRKAVRSQMPVAATLFLFSAAGFLVLCPLSLTLLSVSTIAATTRQEWAMISTAGIFNAIGFFAITHAMRHLTISRTNVINASQNAFCAIGAVIVFGETLSSFGFLGIALTITGLLTLDRK